MRYHVLATDYDGTIAHHGVVPDDVTAALERLRRTGRRLILVTGRELDDLQAVFPRLDLFDHVVAENGALLYRPSTREIRALAEAPAERFITALRARGVEPLSVGRVIVATREPHEGTVLDTIRELGLELQVIFNKGAVMVLPSGLNKAVGLAAALAELGLSAHNAAGVGDAENDHAFLAACEAAVAVANALPTLKERADWVTPGDHGAGVAELAAALIASDLRELEPRLGRHDLALGVRRDGTEVALHPYRAPVLVTGTSGGGKSTFAQSFIERLLERGYQYCIVDPEGDYADLEGATVLGAPEHAPLVDEVLEVLARPGENATVNLLGVPLHDRPGFFDQLLARIQELRARTGRPHWLIVDEAHHVLPQAWRPSTLTLPLELVNVLFITVHPEHVAPEILRAIDLVLTVGAAPADTLGRFAAAAGHTPPSGPMPAGLEPGEILAWRPAANEAPASFTLHPPRSERRRHVRKYAAGELGPDRSFYFRGPQGKLRLRAQNLQLFLQVGEGVDDETWAFHLRRGDFSRWFREAIKDDGLAEAAARVESDESLNVTEARARIRTAVDERYTAPA